MKNKRLQKRSIIQVVSLVILVVLVAAIGVKLLTPSHAATPPSGFLYRNGKQLMLDGKPYFSASIMSYGLTGCGGSEVPTQAETDAFFANMPPNSLIRTWAFRNMEGNLPAVIASAEAHHQKLVLSLSASDDGCGDPDGSKGDSWYGGGYQSTWLPYVERVVAKYKDSPAVGMWEIQNEENNSSSLGTFMESVAHTIKSIDPNHLVETGTQPPWAYNGNDNYKAINSGADIDVLSMHEYDYNASGGAIVSGHFAGSIAAANALNKPLMFGETGVWANDSAGGCHPTDAGWNGGGPSQNLAGRAAVIKQKYDQYYQGGAAVIMAFQVKFHMNTAACDLSMTASDPTIAMIKSYSFPGGMPNDANGGTAVTTTVTPTPSPTPTPTPTPDTSGEVSYDDTVTGTSANQFNYVGSGWNTSSDPAKYGGTDHYDSTAGDTVTFKFSGTRASIYGAKADYYGNASFSVDGSTAVTQDLYASSRTDNTLLWSTPTLAAGTHTVTIKVLGTQDSSSSNDLISIDRAGVVPSNGTATPTPTPTKTPTPTPTATSSCPVTGDVNCDNHVTSLDLAILLSNWNKQAGATHAQGDVSGDTKVTSLDLAIILSNWGK